MEQMKLLNIITCQPPEDNVTNCCRGVSKSCSNLVFIKTASKINMSEKDIKSIN